MPPDAIGTRPPDDERIGRFVARLHAERVISEEGQFEADAARGMAHRIADDLAGKERDYVVGVLVVP
jgi:hypothetical protein